MLTHSGSAVNGSASSEPKVVGRSLQSRWIHMKIINEELEGINEMIRLKSKEESEKNGQTIHLNEVKMLSASGNRDGWVLVPPLESYKFINAERLLLNYVGYPPCSDEPRTYSIRHELKPIGICMIIGVTPEGEDKYLIFVKEDRFQIAYLVEFVRGWGEKQETLPMDLLERKVPLYKRIMSARKQVEITQMGRSRYEDTGASDGKLNKYIIRIPLIPQEPGESEQDYIVRIQGLLRGEEGTRGSLERMPMMYRLSQMEEQFKLSLLEGRPEETNDQFCGDQTASCFMQYLYMRSLGLTGSHCNQ